MQFDLFSDLKPENILIDHEGHVKLCDFGFATILTTCSGGCFLNDEIAFASQDSSNGGGGCGTVMYMAPEIAAIANTANNNNIKNGNSGSCGFPVDWWALGCVLMEMLTGEVWVYWEGLSVSVLRRMMYYLSNVYILVLVPILILFVSICNLLIPYIVIYIL